MRSEFKTDEAFASELRQLLASRNFFIFDGRLVRLLDVPGQGLQFVDAPPQYVAN